MAGKAAELGSVLASSRLSSLYESGPCISRSREAAVYWREKAALGGDMESAEVLSKVLLSDPGRIADGAAWGLIYVDRVGDEKLALAFFDGFLRQPLTTNGADAFARYIELNKKVGCYPFPRGECHFSKEQVLAVSEYRDLIRGSVRLSLHNRVKER